MRELLIPQQFEVNRHEAYCLCQEISRWLYRPISEESKLQPFEVLASVHLKSAGKKLAQRLVKHSKTQKLKLTLTAFEIIAINQVINTYPVQLYNILSEIDRKTLNYEQIIDFSSITN